MVERSLHSGLFRRNLRGPSNGDTRKRLRNEKAIPRAQLPGAFGMDIKSADRAAYQLGELDNAGFGYLRRAAGAVGGDGAVVAA